MYGANLDVKQDLTRQEINKGSFEQQYAQDCSAMNR